MLGIAGFTMDTSRLVEQSSNFRVIIPVLASTYILAPIVAYGLSQALAPESDENFLPAMMIMAAQAGSLASAIALTLMAGGNRELALICTLISNGFTVLLTPFVLELSIGTKVAFPIFEMIARMALVILLPVAVGQLLRPVFWERARRAHDFIRIIPQFIILMFVYTGFSAATGQLSQDKDLVLRFFAACALLHLVLLGANTLLSGALKLQWPDRTALILCGSQKTLPNGIYIWNTFFVSNPYGAVPLVLYHLFQLIVDTLLVPFFEKRNPVSHENCGRSTAISCHQSE
jgi:sodium/bile acid cotransporter 7